MTTKLEALYDYLEEGFDPTDEIILEDTRAEMHRHWRDFLKNGKHIDKLIEMMSPYDLFENYDELTKRGACIPIHLLARDLYCCDYDSRIFEDNFEWFLSRGLDISDLAEYIYAADDNYGSLVRFLYKERQALEKYASNKTISEIVLDCWDDEEYKDFTIEAIREYLKRGLDVELLFEVILNRVPKDWETFENHMLELCDLLYKYGISVEMIERLLDEISDWDYVFFQMIDEECEEWECIGVDCEKYVASYVEYIHRYCPEDCFDSIDGIPDAIRKQVTREVVKKFTTAELMNLVGDLRELVDFLTESVTAKGLAKKYLNEIGYDKAGWLNCWYMLCLLEKDPESLELDKVLAEVAALESDYGRSNFYGYLKDLGVPEEKLSELGIYPVTEE